GLRGDSIGPVEVRTEVDHDPTAVTEAGIESPAGGPCSSGQDRGHQRERDYGYSTYDAPTPHSPALGHRTVSHLKEGSHHIWNRARYPLLLFAQSRSE